MDQHSSGAPIVAAELPEGANGSSSDFANGLVDQGVLEETDARTYRVELFIHLHSQGMGMSHTRVP